MKYKTNLKHIEHTMRRELLGEDWEANFQKEWEKNDEKYNEANQV